MWLEYPGVSLGGWQATLRLATNFFPRGNSIEAELVLKNVSTNTMSLATAWPLLGNGVDVRITDAHKAEVPLTTFGRNQRSSGSASPNVSSRIQPGQAVSLALELSRLYELNSPGVYTIRAKVSVSSSGRKQKRDIETGVAQISIERTGAGHEK
jgi:hypothetical protein